MASQKEFLGRGWSFPVRLDYVSGRVEESAWERSIADSIKIILQTQPGERIMRPDFGCRLREFSFQEMSYTALSQMEKEVRRALTMWEPRIIDLEVRCRQDASNSGMVLIDISYVVRSTNNPYNLVYPFYLTETA
ncbi:GPW/gp25 family protein [Angelakisella massiliensis]|uniref:GPW/gp25 family protein n=1 Tax=Angelakisella massiliensis TaxID=1871018 RepID=UPI0008F8BDE7|nr:GPW/gp25 family protein [Angelakisella massiliensis]